MPAKPAAPNKQIRVVKNNIGTDDAAQYLRTLAHVVSSGKFDAYLDVLYRIVDDRVREVVVDIPDDRAVEKKLGKIRKLREADMKPEIGGKYGVFGERYRGVVVEFSGYASTDYEDGSKKARVLVLENGTSTLDVNTIKLMPLAALMELPPDEPSKEPTTVRRI